MGYEGRSVMKFLVFLQLLTSSSPARCVIKISKSYLLCIVENEDKLGPDSSMLYQECSH
jgi:hypothetical protein